MTEKFKEWVENRHEYAREWKRKTGGKVVGYLCTYVPEEILYAANILPVRIFGSHEPSGLIEPYILSSVSCSFCRDCLAQGLAGRYDYLDGIVMGQSCLHTGQVFWIWSKYIPLDFSSFIWMPWSLQSVGRYEYLGRELASFKESLEKWLGRSITDEDLDRGIETYNLNRRLTRQIYEYRKENDPPITGSEIMELILSSQLTDKEEHNQALSELLRELPRQRLDRETGVRLMIVGSVNDDLDFMRMVENELPIPATFVIEDHCTGLRYCFNEVTPQEDRLMAIAVRYIHRPACPNKDWPRRRRFAYILHLLREYYAQAVILMNQKFCHPHQADNPVLAQSFAQQGIPTQSIEFDITLPARVQTNMEAFLETMVELV